MVECRNQLLLATATIVLVAGLIFPSASASQEPPPTPQPLKGIAVRGCLLKSRLTHVEPMDPGTPFPDSLGVNGGRAIRSQLKALTGHQVELIGTVEGVGPQNAILLAESNGVRFYFGGGDPSVGDDLRRIAPPTFYAHTVRDLAPTCTAQPQQ